MSVELEQMQNNVKGLEAQLNATKQMFNESMTSNLQVRASLILLQQNLQESFQKNNDLLAQVNKLTNRIAELEAPKNDVPENPA